MHSPPSLLITALSAALCFNLAANPAETPPQQAQTPPKAMPVPSDPVQVYGWLEHVTIGKLDQKTEAKLDTGADISSIHAQDEEVFEKDGKKWVRFTTRGIIKGKAIEHELEAPLVRKLEIKKPGGKSQFRQVVMLSYTIGDRTLRGEFSLANRINMTKPVLIGRATIKELGWIDCTRTYIADDKIMR